MFLPCCGISALLCNPFDEAVGSRHDSSHGYAEGFLHIIERDVIQKPVLIIKDNVGHKDHIMVFNAVQGCLHHVPSCEEPGDCNLGSEKSILNCHYINGKAFFFREFIDKFFQERIKRDPREGEEFFPAL
jgi:hypothetical protein